MWLKQLFHALINNVKILTLLGSPHKKGNTSQLLEIFENKITTFGHKIKRINVAYEKLNGCLACLMCKKPNRQGTCAQKDAANSIFSEMITTDKIVYASPLYCWDFPSQMKALIDRHFCLVTNYGTKNHNSVLEGKTASLIVTCAGPIKNNADLIGTVFERVCNYTKVSISSIDIFPNISTPIEINDEIRKRITKSSKLMIE